MTHKRFRWVHISDLHFRTGNTTKDGFNSTELKNRLPEFLKTLAVESAVDALILTGDYRFAPDQTEDPKEVADYIMKLANALNIKQDSIYLVPGNHDLTRDSIRSDVIMGLRSRYQATIGLFEPDRLNKLMDGFSFFKELQSKLNKNDFFSEKQRDKPHTGLSLNGCNLLLLNTAFSAGGDDDERNLLLGMKYIGEEIGSLDTNIPTIAVGHHGMEFLQADEEKACSTFFDNHNIRLYLCGHTHRLWAESVGNKGKEYSVGCLAQDDQTVEAGFSVGSLLDDGTVCISSYKWDVVKQNWYYNPPNCEHFSELYSFAEKHFYVTDEEKYSLDKPKAVVTPPVNQHFSLIGYNLLGGRGIDGIKYYWEREGHIVESLAFNKRLKASDNEEDKGISAYTCSVSYGCRLNSTNQQCLFCETGKNPYYGDVCAEDIALQNIFMAEYDSDCKSYPQVKKNQREFAFMGQGEPGLCYPLVRRSIQLTDIAMSIIGQKVYRYIISTCGISGFVESIINDINDGVFKNRITLHFSLHAINDERTMLMPINSECDYLHFLKDCEKLFETTKEKIGVGILMFQNYSLPGKQKTEPFSLTIPRLGKILSVLDKDIFRIDLCDVNSPPGYMKSALSNENASNLLNYVTSRGFEGKLFSSFDESVSGCGMLSSSCDHLCLPGNTTKLHFNNAIGLLNDAIATLDTK